jgi:hypothetical protein
MLCILSKQKIPIGVIFGGSGNGKCIFYGHLVYFMAVWYILWPFGIFCGRLVHFFLFGMLYEETSGNTGSNRAPTLNFIRSVFCVSDIIKLFILLLNFSPNYALAHNYIELYPEGDLIKF